MIDLAEEERADIDALACSILATRLLTSAGRSAIMAAIEGLLRAADDLTGGTGGGGRPAAAVVIDDGFAIAGLGGVGCLLTKELLLAITGLSFCFGAVGGDAIIGGIVLAGCEVGTVSNAEWLFSPSFSVGGCFDIELMRSNNTGDLEGSGGGGDDVLFTGVPCAPDRLAFRVNEGLSLRSGGGRGFRSSRIFGFCSWLELSNPDLTVSMVKGLLESG